MLEKRLTEKVVAVQRLPTNDVSLAMIQEEKKAEMNDGDSESEQHPVRMAGREARRQKAHLAKQSKEAASTCGGFRNAGQGRPDAIGTGVSGTACPGEPSESLDGAQSLGLRDRSGFHFRCSGGRDAGGVVQSEVSRRRRKSLRRLRPGCVDGSTAGLRQVWQQEDPKELAVLEGMESCAHLARGLHTPSRFGPL